MKVNYCYNYLPYLFRLFGMLLWLTSIYRGPNSLFGLGLKDEAPTCMRKELLATSSDGLMVGSFFLGFKIRKVII